MTANRLLDRTGAPSTTWLLCLQYVCYVLNHSYNATLQNIPLNCLTGSIVYQSVASLSLLAESLL